METGDEQLRREEAGLQESRERLRRELLPSHRDDTFPRSFVMRTLLDPKRQQILLLALSAAAMLVSRSHRQRRGGDFVARVGELTRSMSRGVWR